MMQLKCKCCNTMFLSKQSNYKTCSTKCSALFNKKKQKEYYVENKKAIILRVSRNSKVAQLEQVCIICSSLFKNRKSTKCCSSVCRRTLENNNAIKRYANNKSTNTCKCCNNIYLSIPSSRALCKKCIILSKYNAKDIITANRERKRCYVRNKYKSDINFRLADNLRSRLSSAIKGNYKSGSAVKDLGCTVKELRHYLETKFTDNMSWDNYGKWHIDHIKPLAKFNLTNYEELKGACHYTNLQPLWAKDNFKKGNR